MEAVLYNTILGARPLRADGVSFYYADYNMDATKVDYEQKWPCCSGTFPQLTADYGISSYLHGTNGIYVNLYVPSRLNWRQGDARVSLTQETSYPHSSDISLSLKMDRKERFIVGLRVPEWVGSGSVARVNGKAVKADLRPGGWAEIDRTWQDGDRVELSLDMPLRLVPLDGQHPNLVALVHGPVALFAIGAQVPKMTRQQLLGAQRVGTSGDWEVAADGKKVVMRSYPAIKDERYRLYQEI